MKIERVERDKRRRRVKMRREVERVLNLDRIKRLDCPRAPSTDSKAKKKLDIRTEQEAKE